MKKWLWLSLIILFIFIVFYYLTKSDSYEQYETLKNCVNVGEDCDNGSICLGVGGSISEPPFKCMIKCNPQSSCPFGSCTLTNLYPYNSSKDVNVCYILKGEG